MYYGTGRVLAIVPNKVLARNFGKPCGYGAWGVYMEQESIETTKIEGITSILKMKLHEWGGRGGGEEI
jgi:hypothetical protein